MLLIHLSPMDPNFFLYTFIAFFIIIDPLASIPFFLHVAEGTNEKEYRAIIRKAIVVATIILILFSFFGNYAFEAFGIKMFSFKVAGGILLFIISLEMIFGIRTRTEVSPGEEEEDKDDIAITPMAVPLLTGPGAITTGIVVYSEAHTIEEKIIFLVAILLVFALSYVILYFSHEIFGVLGKTGTTVIMRIMGLLLSAIAVQLVLEGIGKAIALFA